MKMQVLIKNIQIITPNKGNSNKESNSSLNLEMITKNMQKTLTRKQQIVFEMISLLMTKKAKKRHQTKNMKLNLNVS